MGFRAQMGKRPYGGPGGDRSLFEMAMAFNGGVIPNIAFFDGTVWPDMDGAADFCPTVDEIVGMDDRVFTDGDLPIDRGVALIDDENPVFQMPLVDFPSDLMGCCSELAQSVDPHEGVGVGE